MSYRIEQSSSDETEIQTGKKSTIVMERIVTEMLNNPNITTSELMRILSLSKTSVQKYVRLLTEQGRIKHIGSTKSGYWKVVQ